MGSATDLVQGDLEFSVEPDVWFGSVLQAVGTRGVLCVFFQDLKRPFTFGHGEKIVLIGKFASYLEKWVTIEKVSHN